MTKPVEDPISRALKLSNQATASTAPKRRSRAEFSGRPAKSTSGLGLIHTANEIELDPELLAKNRVLVDPKLDDGVTADRYRLLNTRIRQRMTPRNWNKLGITSPAPREGKSLTSLNLAITASRESSEPVILIDADTRRPSLCTYLGVEPPANLTDYLEGKAALSEVVFTSPTYPGLHVIGNLSSANRRAITKDRLNDLFHEIDNENTTIIVDLPPVLVGDDVLLVAPHTDAMLIVLRDEQSNLDDLKQTTELLTEYNLLGTILNGSQEVGRSMKGYYEPQRGSSSNNV